MGNKLLSKVKKMREGFDTDAAAKQRQQRLADLVKVHGNDLVAEAMDLKVSSLLVYLRAPKPNISEVKLTRAESILSDI